VFEAQKRGGTGERECVCVLRIKGCIYVHCVPSDVFEGQKRGGTGERGCVCFKDQGLF